MVSSPEESGRTVAHETCNFPMEITKHEAQSLRMKMRNAELYLKELHLIRVAAACRMTDWRRI